MKNMKTTAKQHCIKTIAPGFFYDAGGNLFREMPTFNGSFGEFHILVTVGIF